MPGLSTHHLSSGRLLRTVRDVVKGLRTHHGIEHVVVEWQVQEWIVGPNELNIAWPPGFGLDFGSSLGQHAPGRVKAGCACSPLSALHRRIDRSTRRSRSPRHSRRSRLLPNTWSSFHPRHPEHSAGNCAPEPRKTHLMNIARLGDTPISRPMVALH